MLSVIIPTFNEAQNIEHLLGSFAGCAEIIFVDDNSEDGTAEVAHKYGTVLNRPKKMGIGSAILDGLDYAFTNLNSRVFIQMDADLSHRLSFIPKLIQPIIEDSADVTIASRYIPGGGTVGWGWKRRQISKWANNMARSKFELPVRDCTSGFRAYNRRVVDYLTMHMKAKGFEFQILSLHSLHHLGYRILEIPYIFTDRRIGESKLKLIDVLRFLKAMV